MTAPRPFREIAPGILQIRQGGGCMLLFCLPFVLAGIFAALTGLRIVPMNDASQMPALLSLVIFIAGLIFIAVGGLLAFGRSWTTLDSIRGLVTKEWGLLVPMRRREYLLGDHTAVIVAFEAGDSDTADRYPVRLQARGGPDVPLYSSSAYGEARDCAALAAFLRLPLEDASTDHRTVVASQQARQPLQQRLRADPVPEEPARPASMRSIIRESNGNLQIVIPAPGSSPVGLAGMVVLAGIFLLILLPLTRFLKQTQTPAPVAWLFPVFLLLMFTVLPGIVTLRFLIQARRGRTLVTVSPTGIVIEQRGAWKSTTAAFAASDILDIDYGAADAMLESARRAAGERMLQSGKAVPGSALNAQVERLIPALARRLKPPGITLKCRQGLASFGEGLPGDEVRYLYSVLKRALAA